MKNTPKHCPKCKADFTGEPIPQEYIDKGYYGEKTHYSRIIGITCWIRDRVIKWRCPDCGHEWDRE